MLTPAKPYPPTLGDRVEDALLTLGAGVVMLAVCWVSITLPAAFGPQTPVWLANAVAICLILSARRRLWVGLLVAVWLGDFIASVLCHEPVSIALRLSLANLAGIATTVCLLGRMGKEVLDPRQSRSILGVAVVAGLIAPLVSAACAAVLMGGLEKAHTWLILAMWLAANSLGALIVIPLWLILRRRAEFAKERPFKARGFLSLFVLTGVCISVFSQAEPNVFIIQPILLWVVFELELLGAAAGVIISLAVAVAATISGRGPFAHRAVSITEVALLSQLFLASITMMSLPAASVLAQRRRLQQRAAESEARYRLVTESSRDIVLTYTPGGVITFASASVAQLGAPPEALIGANILSFVHPEDREAVRAALSPANGAQLTPGENTDYEFRVGAGSGVDVWLQGNPSAIRDEKGVIVAYSNVLRDVTRRRAMEVELREAREAAEAAALVKADFLANMSHELRTPLTSVIGFTRLALDNPGLDSKSRDYIDKAARASGSLLTIINDILDFSTLESGQINVRLAPAAPEEVLRSTLDLFEEAAAQKDVALRLELVDLPPRLILDQGRVRQILLNLIGNAVKFTEAGEIVLTADWRDDVFTFAVADQGSGISEDQQALLFRRFSQVDGSSTRRFGGTGLGLAICRGLAEAMGGDIQLQSQPQQGSVFTVRLPAQAATETSAPAPTPEPPATLGDGARILIADDHAANREFVRAVLSGLEVDVYDVENGRDAVEISSKQAFELILMDLRMPVLDGPDAVRQIRSLPGPNRATPILAFSAGVDPSATQARIAAGFTGDLPKPVLPADLIAAVLAHCPGEA